MASTTLRSRSRTPANVETLADRHTALVRERQQLRASGADEAALELNRLAIVDCQWQLSRALIERYLPPATVTSAA